MFTAPSGHFRRIHSTLFLNVPKSRKLFSYKNKSNTVHNHCCVIKNDERVCFTYHHIHMYMTDEEVTMCCMCVQKFSSYVKFCM